MHAVIFAGGDCADSPLSQTVLKTADLILAADGGAESALQLGVFPKAVIGDFDSLKPSIKKELTKKGAQIISFRKEKDETDTELAILHAEKLGATKITIFGGIAGDRIDHILATIFLGFISPVPLEFISAYQHAKIVIGPATVSLSGKKGDLLSLIPFKKDVKGISTKNLYYPL